MRCTHSPSLSDGGMPQRVLHHCAYPDTLSSEAEQTGSREQNPTVSNDLSITLHMYVCIIWVLSTQAAMVDQRVKSKKKSKAKEEEAAIQAAISAAKAAAAAGVTVRIHSVNETAGRQTVECPQMDLAGQRPMGLHGGALLGIAVAKHLKSGMTLTTSLDLVHLPAISMHRC